MVKFSKQLEIQLVPEWKGAYCSYKLLKKDLKNIQLHPPHANEPSLNPTSPRPFAVRRRSTLSQIDVIRVHHRKSNTGDEPIYETELLGPIAQSEYAKSFFTRLDVQLNKVNEFYKNKEGEFVQRGLLLDKQMHALNEVQRLLKQDHPHLSSIETDTGLKNNSVGNSLDSLESGLLHENQALLNSFARASIGATSLPDLLLKKETVHPMEPNGVLSRERSFSELPAASITRSSSDGSQEMPETSVTRSSTSRSQKVRTANNKRGSQVKLSIPRDTPAATISALSQMLWEDVLRQAKRTATDHRGKEDIVVSRKKVQSAENMLQAAFVEFYRGLGLLRSYSSLNMVAFAKILKKYDKVSGVSASGIYMSHVENSYFGTSKKAVEIMEKVEALFTEHFTKQNRRQAMASLKPPQRKASHTVTYFLGLFTGCSLALMAAFGIILQVDGDYNNAERITYLQCIFPTFRMLALILLHMYMYGWNVYMWRSKSINYAFIFEFSLGSELRMREVLLICTGLTTVLVGAMVIHLSMHSSLFQTEASAYVDLIPFTVVLAFLVLLFNPFKVCYRSSRFFLLKTLLHLISAPLYKVVLADFFLADQLTSQVPMLRNLEFVICYYLGGFFVNKDSSACTTSKDFLNWTYVIAILPYWFRFWQCIRRWFDEADKAHLANAAKYLSAMVSVALKIAYGNSQTAGWLAMFIIVSTVTTVYQVYWDMVIDWGLLRRDSENRWLRDQLTLDYKSIYFVSMVLNFLLRLAWLQSVTHFQFTKGSDTSVTDFIFACLEVVRRGQWNFYREHTLDYNIFFPRKSFDVLVGLTAVSLPASNLSSSVPIAVIASQYQ